MKQVNGGRQPPSASHRLRPLRWPEFDRRDLHQGRSRSRAPLFRRPGKWACSPQQAAARAGDDGTAQMDTMSRPSCGGFAPSFGACGRHGIIRAQERRLEAVVGAHRRRTSEQSRATDCSSSVVVAPPDNPGRSRVKALSTKKWYVRSESGHSTAAALFFLPGPFSALSGAATPACSGGVARALSSRSLSRGRGAARGEDDKALTALIRLAFGNGRAPRPRHRLYNPAKALNGYTLFTSGEGQRCF